MKKRILSIVLALVLLVGVLTVPVSAAPAKEVHSYLKNIAMDGYYDSELNAYYDGFVVDSDNGIYYAIYYLVDSKYIECSLFNNSFEVTWRISSNPSPAYTAFILVYDEQNSKGNVAIGAGYNGSPYSGFSSFTGNSSLKSAMLEALNGWLPIVVEFTRAVINEGGYTLKDLGITGYTACNYVHAFDDGKVTRQPTCVNDGVLTYTCRVCGQTRTESIAATGEHQWDNGTVLTAPTCTAAGVRRYTCTVCGSTTRDETIPALGHAWTLTQILTEPGLEGTHSGRALYTCSRCNETREDKLCAGVVFRDMPPEGFWSHDPIDWAWINGITGGTGPDSFSPDLTVTRSQVVTFLWAAAEKPTPETTTSPFTDVKEGDWFLSPVLWAVEHGVTGGVGNNQFGPNMVCSRAQIVTFLWAAAGKPEPEMTESPFTDVKEGDWYLKAVLWAVENGVTGGVGNNQFGPDMVCTRAQAVTFLYKASQIPTPEEPLEP